MKNVIYILSRTWKYEKAIIGILLLQTIIGVATPFISMYLPVVTLKGITGELPIECMWMETISLIVILMVCNIINAYINADFDTHLMNNKIHYLADLFHKNMKLSYAYIESKEGQNRFQYVLRTLTNDAQGGYRTTCMFRNTVELFLQHCFVYGSDCFIRGMGRFCLGYIICRTFDNNKLYFETAA